jgi:hypothetical protein
MLENFKYLWNIQMFVNHTTLLQRALDSGNEKLINRFLENAMKSGRRAMELSEVVEGISVEATAALQKALGGVVQLYESMQQSEPVEQDPIRRAVKRQYVQLCSQMGVAGGGKTEDFIADTMVGMYRIAADRLNGPPEVLRMIYVDNDAAPEPLRNVVGQYVDGKLTKEQATEQLAELKSKTEQYARDLGASPDKAQRPTMIYQVAQGLEQKLMGDIVADSMRNDGTVDQKQLFMNTAEIVMYSKWAGLAKRLEGRQPTSNELIDAQIEAYRATREVNPSLGFGDDKEFEAWIGRFEQLLKSKGNSYLQAALPVYYAVVEKFTK